jgi:hypothetical protein
LYPLHIVTLIIVAPLQYIYLQTHGQYFIFSESASSFIAQLFASSWFNWRTASFNGPIWSISVEILVPEEMFTQLSRAAGSRIWLNWAWLNAPGQQKEACHARSAEPVSGTRDRFGSLWPSR